MEENMQMVNTMIGNLRNMAMDMGSEVESQNKQSDRIIIKVGQITSYEFLIKYLPRHPPMRTE